MRAIGTAAEVYAIRERLLACNVAGFGKIVWVIYKNKACYGLIHFYLLQSHAMPTH